MSNIMVILDIFVVTGLCVSAILACHLDNLLSISEAAVGAALSPLIFIVTLKKIKGKGGDES